MIQWNPQKEMDEHNSYINKKTEKHVAFINLNLEKVSQV